MQMRPCPACRRHVRADADACPFCSAELPRASIAPQLAYGRLSRAAVFAGAALTGAACGSDASPPAARPTETAPPPPMETAPPSPTPAPEPPPTPTPEATPAPPAPTPPPTPAPPPTTTPPAPAPAPPAQAQRPPATGTGTIRGTVVNSQNRQPLAHAEVIISAPGVPSHTVQTDGNGVYRIAGLPPGGYTVKLDSNHPRRPGPSRTVTLKAGETLQVDLAMYIPPPSATPMPYGAPPARRRVV